MRGQRAVVDAGIAALVAVVAERLAPARWVERSVAGYPSGVFTGPTRAGVMATAEIGRVGFQFPDVWPVQLRLRLGVGHEAVLGLSPLLTLSPIVAVLPNLAIGGGGLMMFDLAGEADIAATADRLVATIDNHAVAFAEGFADLDALIRARGSATGSGEGRDWGPDGPPSPELEVADRLSMVDLTLLAAGRHEQTAALLELFESKVTGRGALQLDRRFVRQLKRWLDAGSPPIPRAEDTLARLPVPPEITAPSWSDARQRSRELGAAFNAARNRARGMSMQEVFTVLEEEYAQRGLDSPPSTIAIQAERIHLEQQPLGRARFALRTAAELAGASRRAIELLRRTVEDPAWMRLPDRATFPVAASGGKRDASVIVDDTAVEFLTRVLADGSRRLPGAVRVDIWFTAGAAGPEESVIAVHIGAHQVGTLAPEYLEDFTGIFNAAAMFDEDPVATATLHHRTDGPWYLEFKLPQRSGLPDDVAGTAEGREYHRGPPPEVH